MIKILGQKALEKKLKGIVNNKVANRAFLERVSQRGVQLLQNEAKPQSATGLLANSMAKNIKGNVASIGSVLNYAYTAMETGRRAGKAPPMSALRRWAGLKLGDPKLAFVVARSIGQQGTRKKRRGGPKRVTRVIKTLNKITIPKELVKFGKALLSD